MSDENVKKLLGSISYGIRIEILEKFEKIQDLFARLEFFDRRRKIREIIIDNFELLIAEITNFWEKDAQLALYPRKTAAWLSDYLVELGYPEFDFSYVLRAITHKLEEVDELAKLADLIELTDPDIKPKMQKIDISLPKTGKGAFLAQEIDKFIEEAPKTMKSSVIFIDQEGHPSTIKIEQDIVKSDDTQKNEFLTTTVFENPLDIPITDVQINNVVPYHYKVTDMKAIGFEGIEPTKKLLDDGLQLTWIIPEVKPKQETKIELNLERRISRTILLNIGTDVNIINTYFNIVPIEDRYSASNSFTNAHQENINHLIIEDEIPMTFNLLEVKPPDDIYSMNMEKQGFEQLLKWQYEEVQTTKEIRHLYYLMDKNFFILTHILVKEKQNTEPLLEIYRLIEPNIRFYELIVSYYIKFNKSISELYIKEQIPEKVNVTFSFPQTVEKAIEITQNKTIQSWKIRPDPSSNQFEFGYICSGETIKTEFPIDLFIPQIKVPNLEESTTESKNEPFFLPEIHQILEQHKSTLEATSSQ